MRPLPPLLAAAWLLAAPLAHADVTVIDDFETPGTWVGLGSTDEAPQGAAAGDWPDTVNVTSARRAFDPPLDLSGATHVGFWLYSEVANEAALQLIFLSEAPSEGMDYYSREIALDWSGWRWFWLRLDRLGVSRSPRGWDQIDQIQLAASGWGHTPQADTRLGLDYFVSADAMLDEVTTSSRWEGEDMIYDYTLHLSSEAGADVELVVRAEGLEEITRPLRIEGAMTESVEVRIPEARWRADPWARAPITIEIVEEGVVEAWEGHIANPGDHAPAPRAFLAPADFERIAAWREVAWADERAQGIIDRAARWREDFEARYGSAPDAPPEEGGQWGMHYVCPTHGVYLRYEPPMTHRCPVDDQTYSGWPYDQVIYGRIHTTFGRAARDNGLAYRFTGEAAFAEEAAAILRLYVDAYLTYPLHDKSGGVGAGSGRIGAQTLEESAWLIDIAWAYDLIADAGALTPEERARIAAELLYPGAAVLEAHDARESNWQAWHNAGIAMIGRALDDPRLFTFALYGRSGFEMHMEESVLADGLWYEGSWGYHFYTLTPMIYLAELAERAGLSLYDDPRLRSMFEAPIDFALPDLTLPTFNDAGEVDLAGGTRWAFEPALRAYDDPRYLAPLRRGSRREQALFWGALELPEGVEADPRSARFDATGVAILRNRSEEDPWYLALDFGPHGGWHGHLDKLGFVFYARGALQGLDPGSHSYALPLHHEWDQTTAAHNTVLVDEANQAQATGALEAFDDVPHLALARASAGPVYEGAALRRTMVMVDDYVLDRVEARALDDAAHRYDWLYHNPHPLEVDAALEPYDAYPNAPGYMHLTANRAAALDGDVTARFGAAQGGHDYGTIYRSDGAAIAHNERVMEGRAGMWGGRLTYDFSQAQGSYIVFGTASMGAVVEAPEVVSVWVNGDASGNRLRLRVIDGTGEAFASEQRLIDWEGWQEISLPFDDAWGHWSGDDDGVVDLPLRQLTADISHVEGAALSGAIGLDDWSLTSGGAARVVEDYEILSAIEELYVVGAPGTTLVVGEGVGLDLTEPVPYVALRREGRDVDFDVLHAPRGLGEDLISSVTPLLPEGQDAQLYRIETRRGADALWIAPARREVAAGGLAVDARVAWLRRCGEAPCALVILDGRALEEGGRVYLEAPEALSALSVSWAEGVITIEAAEGSLEGLRLWGPEVVEVLHEGAPVAFAREGGHVVLAPPQVEDAGVIEDAAVVDAAPVEDASLSGDAPLADAEVTDDAAVDATPPEDAGVIEDATLAEDASQSGDAPLVDAEAAGDAALVGDQGTPHDAAPLGDAASPDAGAIDAGQVDGEGAALDAAPSGDAAPDLVDAPTSVDDGCGCASAPSSGALPALWLALLLLARRRRAR